MMYIVETLGYLGSFISSLAVVASVVYVAMEVKRANRLARLSAIDALRDATNRFREILLQDGNLDVWLKGVREEEMTDIEHYRWDELALYLWDSTQATYLRAVELDEKFSVRRISYSVRFASQTDGFAKWFRVRRARFHPDFVAFVEDNLGKSLEGQSPALPEI